MWEKLTPLYVVVSQQPQPCVSNSALPTSSSVETLEMEALSLFLKQLNDCCCCSFPNYVLYKSCIYQILLIQIFLARKAKDHPVPGNHA